MGDRNMTFAEALARIEELAKDTGSGPYGTASEWNGKIAELRKLLFDNADSIVQLRKVAAEMRAEIKTGRDIISGTIPQVFHVSTHGLAYACEAYDKLVKGE